MTYDRIRIYDAGQFHDATLPDWYDEVDRLIEEERIDWHVAIERVLNCEGTLLTECDGMGGALEIRFWPSERQGTLVLIETPFALIEQILVLNPIDWLPFLSRYLAPLITASNQSAAVAAQTRIANAVIARARHGEGLHIDRETGLSRIDIDRDRERRWAERARSAMDCHGGPA